VPIQNRTFHGRKIELPNGTVTRSREASLLPRPEHHIYAIGYAYPSNVNLTAWEPFPFLKLDIIRRDDVRKQRLNFIDSKESSGTENNR